MSLSPVVQSLASSLLTIAQDGHAHASTDIVHATAK
jgi:hypothetical protein